MVPPPFDEENPPCTSTPALRPTVFDGINDILDAALSNATPEYKSRPPDNNPPLPP